MGEALDALTPQLEDDDNAATLVIVQKPRPDRFFTAAQQQRREELMRQWREAQDAGAEFPAEAQAELEQSCANRGSRRRPARRRSPARQSGMNFFYTEVALRAGRRCEYCRAPENIFNFHFDVEHIMPAARGGTNDRSNLALACPACNVFKSNFITGFDADAQAEAPLFHPRRDQWQEHFHLDAQTGWLEASDADRTRHRVPPANEPLRSD